MNRNYSINQRQLFDENYGLASTQNLKNKNSPGGGGRGTTLLLLDPPPVRCFEKSIDTVIDLRINEEPTFDLYSERRSGSSGWTRARLAS